MMFAREAGLYGDLLQDLDCPVLSLGARSAWDALVLPRAVRQTRRFDLHHFHSLEPLMFCASLMSGSKVRIYTERGGSHRVESLTKQLRFMVARPILRRFFHALSANTAHAARVGAARHRLSVDRFMLTYNGIDFSLLQPSRDRESVRAELSMPSGFVVGTAAHLKPWKRVDRLLEACARLQEIDLYVVIVGDGADRTRLEERAAELSILPRVRFTGMVARIGDYLNAMDAFVLPSDALESFGNAAVEAMSQGLPTVVFDDSPGVCEHITPGRTGFIVSNIAELSQVLRDLANDEGLRSQIGAAGAAAVRSRYTIDAMVDSYQLLYAAAMGRT